MEPARPDEIDARMMARCLDLARTARSLGELPFACVIARGEELVAEGVNEAARQRDLTRHAEIVTISRALRALGARDLRGCALYTSVEPCAMCAMAMREARVERVAFALASPLMGGLGKWNILGDDDLSTRLPEYFGTSRPTVVAGLMAEESRAVWREAHPLVWSVIESRGCFVVPPSPRRIDAPPPTAGRWLSRFLARFAPGR